MNTSVSVSVSGLGLGSAPSHQVAARMRGGRRPDLLREVRKSTYTLLRTLSRETLKASHTATKFVAHAIADLASSSADEDWAQRQHYHNRSRTTKHDRSSRGFHNSNEDNNDMYNDDFGDYSPEIGSRNPQPVGVMVRRKFTPLEFSFFLCIT